MKRFLKKLSFIILIIFNFSLINVFAITKEYFAYSKYTSEGTAFFVNDDGEKTVYCYNHDYKPPGSPNEDSINKTYYTREESYLNTDDELMDKYGKEIKERIAALLVYGYPLNSSNLMEQYGLNEDQARYITQQLVWDITNGNDAPFGDKYGMYGYYDKLLELSKIKKFEQGNLNLIGNFKFIQRNGIYLTDKLSTTGNSGSFTITNLPENMAVKDWNTNQILNDKPIKVGQEFYIESSAKPDSSLKLKISYNYQEVKFYFYKYSRGGLNTNPDLPYQSLIRAELEDKFTEKPYEISIDGNFVPSQDIGKVVLTKKDSKNGNLLEGAVFNLQDQQGNNIRTNLITDENGQIILNDLAPGDYQFVETKAPNGYELDTTPVKFTIVVGQTETVNIEKVNTASLGGVVLTKKDSKNGNLLEGAVFNLQDQQGNDIRTNLISDENGQIILNDLAPGDYQFVETKAPEGYELDATPVKFTIVVGQKEAVKVEKTNILAATNLKISKIDSNTKNPLNGSEFEIYSQNDTSNPLKFITTGSSDQYEVNIIGESTLMANGVDSSFTINKLGYGDYILKEIKAPSGYKLGKDIYIHLDKINSYYKIGSDGEKIDLNKDESLNLYNINVENEKGIVLPETGGNGFITQRNIAIMVLGISFILMINFLINKKRRIN
ncbi:TPA: Cys-Gln thioester bond-forming surface protein [Clostridium perfringens]|uniref:SpaA isopeptide-forming pilin-related protein n=1 Tax=Clostridium perfringens TaxID=1502 RepID=UPI0006C384D5|nr:SpaA isopeptide-forming pilin-related protein [Clostridium perfringens]MDK0586910.1 SpaA isopeptide-forming pilin-related protein [Clostridium perfringens]MDK0791339.1 SpaA isopeptide-forming pilin-related protein [Clostridium perfringens]PWX18262.1 thioester-forming surface-anchored protein [Clostridium perfringens]PWX29549.1 thioester-forming surface-anchored protein [Clostridium perfringens]CUO83185.1 cell wall surface anchor family protein [Clostridium perfringens]